MIEAIGVDEIQWRRGHSYLTLVYQIEEGMKRLFWVAPERTEQSLRGFFQTLSEEVRLSIRFVCSDMWQPYLNVVAEQLKHAVHVLDRFHIMKKMNEAIDEVRRGEAARLERDGYEPVLKHSRWCLLKRPENRTEKETVNLSELLQYNLQSVRSHLLREDFQRFWEYTSPGWAVKFLDQWCTRTMRSKIEPMKKMARSLRDHRDLILNWFRAQGTVSAGAVEGLNNKAKLTTRKAYGFRTFALYGKQTHVRRPNPSGVASTGRFSVAAAGRRQASIIPAPGFVAAGLCGDRHATDDDRRRPTARGGDRRARRGDGSRT